MKVKVLRATVIQGRPRIIGDVLEVTKEDMARLGGRIEIIADIELVEPEPERTIDTVAEHATLVAQKRTAKRAPTKPIQKRTKGRT